METVSSLSPLRESSKIFIEVLPLGMARYHPRISIKAYVPIKLNLGIEVLLAEF